MYAAAMFVAAWGFAHLIRRGMGPGWVSGLCAFFGAFAATIAIAMVIAWASDSAALFNAMLAGLIGAAAGPLLAIWRTRARPAP